ncbi:MAG: NAD(P)H-hydrate epimerase [Firmicutes bacterium]|nr:NAD(P)H-hydrate epimerase [Bacillota bacterium]
MIGGYKIVTLCGSTRFKNEFMEAQKRLTLDGCIVISVGLFGHSGDSEVWENMDEGTLTRTKEMLDDMHKRKIDMADEIYVINVGGYIGDSTRSEIAYAKATGKGVRYLEPVLSVAQMRAADAYTIAKGTPSKELMRRAAQGVFDAYDGWEGHHTLVICGSGNNGGDGYALAEILAAKGFAADVLRVSEKFSEDGAYYCGRCTAAGIRMLTPADPVDLADYDILVDCMLGTGFSGVPREPVAGVIRRVNEARAAGSYVISVDINSGMNGDTGEAELAVASDLTVSIGYPKTGFYSGRADELIGRLVNVDIGIELPEDQV